ncbi:MAG: GNAT family N-acetyltransferase [Verrucomicrobiales bacterium]|nr:GNAT family N-acetyltransferase [Verrucomicrobiales bacterium]
MNLDSIILRPLTRDEFNVAVDWAAAEGWNPGLHDADVFWQTDPDGYLGAEYEGELVATGSIVSYGRAFGFMGFFIVREDLRGRGIGAKLWHHRRDTLRGRLDADAAIGMDGVFDMQEWYGRGGFEFSHRNLRMEGVGQTCTPDPGIVGLDEVPFDELARYDRNCFGCDRTEFLRRWIEIPNASAIGLMVGKKLQGYGVMRECREGFKIGPLFADNPDIAQSLFAALSDRADGQAISLDAPERNAGAMALAERHGMREVFGCARMYHGKPPATDWDRTFGITTFELG